MWVYCKSLPVVTPAAWLTQSAAGKNVKYRTLNFSNMRISIFLCSSGDVPVCSTIITSSSVGSTLNLVQIVWTTCGNRGVVQMWFRWLEIMSLLRVLMQAIRLEVEHWANEEKTKELLSATIEFDQAQINDITSALWQTSCMVYNCTCCRTCQSSTLPLTMGQRSG